MGCMRIWFQIHPQLREAAIKCSTATLVLLTVSVFLCVSGCRTAEEKLEDAIRRGDLNAVQRLVNSGVEINVEKRPAAKHLQPLVFAVFEQQEEIVAWLLNNPTE